MDTALPPYRPEASARYGEARDAAITDLLDTHPVTAGTLLGLGWFPTRKKARERLLLLMKRGEVRRVGIVRRPRRPAEDVYCRWQPKSDQLLHEMDLTEVCLRMSAARILRGPDIQDRAVRPDAEVWIKGRLFYVELDRGTMREGQIEARAALYAGCRCLALWVCANEGRLSEVRTWMKAVPCDALFTTFAEAAADPHAPIWQDFDGSRLALLRERPAEATDGGRPRPEEDAAPPA